MSFALTTFLVSGGLIILMIVLKIFQEKSELLLFWPHARNKSESFLQYHYKSIKYLFTHITRRHIYIFLYYVLKSARNLFARLVNRLDKRSFHLVSLIKGKQKVEQEGKASHFLHDVSRFRDRFRKH